MFRREGASGKLLFPRWTDARGLQEAAADDGVSGQLSTLSSEKLGFMAKVPGSQTQFPSVEELAFK